MKITEAFKKPYKALVKKAIKKSLIYSLIISFACLFIISFIFWLEGFKKFYIPFIIFGSLEIILFSIFFLLNKPDERKLSKELDSLGLEQRVITMYEYQNDDSLMARIQRENAIEKVNKVDLKLLKFVAPIVIIIFLISSCVLGVSASTASVLSANGIIRSGKTLIDDVVPKELNSYTINYSVKKGGYIDGEVSQTVKEGESCTPVIAIANHGYIFVSWSDGVRDPYRLDSNVSRSLDLYASFITIEEYIELLKDPGEPDLPEDPNEGGSMPIPRPGEDGDPGAFRYEENSQINDGETYYGDSVFDGYQEQMIEELASDSEMAAYIKKIINDYFDTIEK